MGATNFATESFSLTRHIAGTVAILVASGVGAMAPVFLAGRDGLAERLDTGFMFGKSMGTGILMSTALIHLLPPAFKKLQDSPSLGIWSEVMAGVVAGFVILAMQFIEFMFVERLAESSEDSPLQIVHHNHGDHNLNHGDYSYNHSHNHDHRHDEHAPILPKPIISYTDFAANHKLTRRESLLSRMPTVQPSREILPQECHHGHQDPCTPQYCGHAHMDVVNLASANRRKISTYILLLGIVSHSVIIGMTLGITGDGQFTSLLIALCFHQMFEGFALAVKILESQESQESQLRPTDSTEEVPSMNWTAVYSLTALFVLTTPLGSTIGIMLRTFCQEFFASPSRKVVEGCFDSASAGILLFVSMSSLASESDFGHIATRREKVIRFAGLWLGAGVMAILGKWA